MTLRPPNLFVVGAAKCGTTAMCEYLARHPQVYIPPEKELNFFGTDMDLRLPRQSWEEYLQTYFSCVKDEATIGDGSVWYIYTRTAAAEIHERVPDARIVIMLRQPVAMLHSLHGQFLYNGNETVESFSEALGLEAVRRQGRELPASVSFPEQLLYRAIADYAPQVERFYEVFGRDRVQVILFDDFHQDTAAVYRSTLEFLDIDPGFTTTFEVINPAKKVRLRSLQNFLLRPPARRPLVGPGTGAGFSWPQRGTAPDAGCQCKPIDPRTH